MNGRSIPAAGSRRPARIVAAIGLVAGLGFALLTPPLSGYDEAVHFLRGYQVSQGGLIATHDGERLGGSLPTALRTDLSRLLTEGVYSRHDHTEFLDRLGDPPAEGKKEFFEFPSAAVYSAVPYAPAALFMAIGRLLGVSTLALMYLGRIGGLVATIGLLSLAVRRMPTRAWMLAAVALLPVTLFQAATISADGITIALAFLVVALALDVAATPRSEVTKRRLIEIGLATLALGLAKPPYVLFALLLVVPMRRHGGDVARALGAAAAAGFAATAAWGAYASSIYVAPRLTSFYIAPYGPFAAFNNVDPHRQQRFVLAHPWYFVETIARTISAYWADFLRDMVAQVPLWLVPAWIAVAGLVIVAACSAIPEERSPPILGGQSRALLVGIALACFLALMLLAYFGWNAVESPRIEAFQGRYLLPLVPLLLLALPPRRARGAPSDGRRFGAGLAAASGLLLAIVWFGSRSHFY